MKFKKLLSCFLSVALCVSVFASVPFSVSASETEEFSDTMTQTVFELDADDIKAGNVPAYVNVNTSILDSTNTSGANGVLSKVVSEDTNFIQIDLEAAARVLPGTDNDKYAIEIVTNAVDSDDTTKNGTLMYVNGTSDIFAFRAREDSDFSVLKNDWGKDLQYKSMTTNTTANYKMTDLKLSDGTGTHTATYDTATKTGEYLFNSVAHNSTLSSWTGAPIEGITIKAANGYRANIKTLKITRDVTFSSDDYIKGDQTVYEMNVNDLKSGTVPTGVTLNTSILDSTNSSAANGLVSTSVTADTDFIALDFEKAGRNLLGGDTGIYTIEIVANAVDSDDTTKNGTLMYVNGTSDTLVFRAREGTDFTVANNSWGTQYKDLTTNTTANYKMTDLKLSNGTGTHTATYDTATKTGEYLFSGVAHDSTLSSWTGAPIKGITIKAANGYRANIKSLKITRKAYLENKSYQISVSSEDDNKGTVSVTGLTDGQAQSGSSVTLTATPKSGYIFSGWYKSGEETVSSTENPWTFNAVESVSYVAKFSSANEVTQTVYEMDIDGLKSGTVPSGITLNTDILDESASSSPAGLISDVSSSQTAFLTIDLKEASKNLSGQGTGIYTIEVVLNQNDSDSDTLNGTIMSMTGTAKKDVWRVRESADIAVLDSWSSTSSLFSSGSKSGETASYVFTDLNVNTGAMVSHTAKYGTNPVYNGYANGQAVASGNASSENPINTIEFRTATTSSGGGMRANIKSLKITRKAMVQSTTYTINAVSENETYGSVETSGISTDEETKGQVSGGSEVTLTAVPNDGYMFKGWYKEGEDAPASTDKVWTFSASESVNYTARFVKSYVFNKQVFKLDPVSLKNGTVPKGVTFNSSILDSDKTSADALISSTVTSETEFMTINLSEVGLESGEEGGDIYTIELVTNLNDDDGTTKNGTGMYINGTKYAFRARESSDYCVMTDSWGDMSWNAGTGLEAHYTIKELNVETGAATSHLARRKVTANGFENQYSSNATGGALSTWSGAPVTTLVFKVPANYRANIKSIIITRNVEIPLEYVNVEALTENDSYGIVNDIGDTAIKQSEITLTATAKDGYVFDGWYSGNTRVSDKSTYTFRVTSSFSYKAKFRKVVDEWIEVYGMNISDILNGNNTNGVSIQNLDTTNSSASNGLISAESDASQDFMTITFANLPVPSVNSGDVLTDIYRVDMKFNLVDSDDTAKNGALVYYNEAKSSNMLARMRETRDGTFYKNGSDTVYGGTVGTQQIPSLAYNFKIDTDTGLFNQYVKHGTGDYYLFTDTATRGSDITLPSSPEKIIIRNADYNSGGVNENYRVNIKSLSIKRLVKVVDTGNVVPIFSKDRVTVVADSGEIWNGEGAFTTDISKIIIDLGSEVESSQITSDSVFITCNDVKIDSTATPSTGADGVTLVTLTGMTFEDGNTYKIIATDIVNKKGASLQKENEYVAITTKSLYEGIKVRSVKIGGNPVTSVSGITANTEITVDVAHTNIATEKDVYLIYIAYKDGTKADCKLYKLEDIVGSGNREAKITTGNVSGVEEVDFILWEGWNSMKLFDSYGF